MLREYRLQSQPTVLGTRVIHVVLIPSIGPPVLSQWRTSTESWLDTLLDETKLPARVWAYEHTRSLSNSSCLEQIFTEGYNLLDQLFQLIRSEQSLPLFFICYALGGTILKKALGAAREQWTQYEELINRISGILFISSPNIEQGSLPEVNVIESILRTNQDYANFRQAWTARDNAIMRQLCTDFAMLNMPVPIISAYEERETKVYRIKKMFSKFQSTKTVMIVGEKLSPIVSANAIRFGLAADFNTVCSIRTSSTLYKELERVLTGICTTPVRPVQGSIGEPCNNVQPGSLRSYSTFSTGVAHATRHSSRHDFLFRDQVVQGPSVQATPDVDILASAISSLHHSLRNPKLPQFSVPLSRNQQFVGRNAILDTIHSHLSPTSELADADSLLRVFFLSGMPGIGKTSTALEYTYRYRDEYDSIFWLHSDNETILGKEFAAIGALLELEDKNVQTDLNASRDVIKRWLSNPYRFAEQTGPKARWLIIFDNVDDFKVIDDYGYWPGLGQGSIIITSRDTMVEHQILANTAGINLDVLSTDETIELFRNIEGTRASNEREVIRPIAEKMDGLPLAIIHVAGMKSSLRISYSDLARLYDTMAVSDGHLLASQLGLRNLNPEACALLQAMSLLDPDEIPEDILRNGYNATSVESFPTNELQYYTARAALLKSSLVTYNERRQYIGMHRIVRDVARSMMTKVESAEYLNVGLALVSRLWAFQDLRLRWDTARWSTCEKYFPSIVRLREAYPSISSNAENFVYDASHAELFNDAGWYWIERGFNQESKAYFELAQIILARSPSRATKETLYSLRLSHNNMYAASTFCSDAEGSLKHAKIWLSMTEARTDDSGSQIIDYELGAAFNETGFAYAMNEQYTVAEDYLLKSIDIFQSLDNYDDTMLGWPEPNLGLVYWVQGRHNDALHVLYEILEIYANAYGVDDTNSFKTGKILHALGNVHESLGELDQAFDFHQRCLKQYMATLGPNHRRVGPICHRLTSHYLRLRNFETAGTLIKQSLAIFSSKPDYKRELARSKFKEGQLFEASGNADDAQCSYKQAFEMRKAIYPGDLRDQTEIGEGDFDQMVDFYLR